MCKFSLGFFFFSHQILPGELSAAWLVFSSAFFFKEADENRQRGRKGGLFLGP